MKFKNLITIGFMCLLMIGLTIGCDQEDSDVGEGNPIGNIEGIENIEGIIEGITGSTVSIGFNINVKEFIDYKALEETYGVTSDWISDATMDIIDSVWVVFHDGTSDGKFNNISVAPFIVKHDNQDGTGSIYAGITNPALASQNGLTLNVILVKYKDGYDGKKIDKDSKDKVYYLGFADNYIVIDQNIELGFDQTCDVTVDGVWQNFEMNIPEPAGSN